VCQGYSRKGAALFQLGRLEDAESAYKEGLMKSPDNTILKSGLEEVKAIRGWFGPSVLVGTRAEAG